jgi:hypothetical protein
MFSPNPCKAPCITIMLLQCHETTVDLQASKV